MIRQGDHIENARTGQRMIFLKTWAETNGTQLQIECFSPVTPAREPEHIHPYQENRFKVLAGQLSFCINRKEQTAYPGDVVSIPKNVPHYFWNSGNSEAHYIQEFFPALKIDSLFETFFSLARDGKLNKKGSPNIFQASLIMLAHEKEIRLARPSWIVQKTVFKLFAPIGKLLGYKSLYK
ncbi:cupin domain-containing protein [Niastella caeni]|uniref:Cupin domain-containing protein n=1 Tax=Niastella caeni TaxID=2569763 RepID=A0A4S8HY92_9BACT|nr:cupin domain-containing protein [Niastella caeni]THU38202.1 cupin domain-containing protein [Niastella caeni]